MTLYPGGYMDTEPASRNEPKEPAAPSFKEAFLFWLKLGRISFGGPAGQIAVMHLELVDRKIWISNEEFLHALNYCLLLPGPEAQQLAIHFDTAATPHFHEISNCWLYSAACGISLSWSCPFSRPVQSLPRRPSFSPERPFRPLAGPIRCPVISPRPVSISTAG